MSSSEQDVVKYYRMPESRLGYRLILRGKKHFGYFPTGRLLISMASAMRNMEEELAEAIGLAPGSRVLDAGCGEGAVSLRLARLRGLRVDGVDLLEFNIKRAARRGRRARLASKVAFRCGSYQDLPFADGTFDGVFTLETLVHSTNHEEALREFNRVVRAHGRLVLFEYTMPPIADLDPQDRKVFEKVIRHSAMFSFPSFTHGSFPAIVAAAGFECESVVDISERVIPMLRRFSWLACVPYLAAKAVRREHWIINAMAGYEFYRLRHLWRYNIVTARKVDDVGSDL